MQLPYLTRCFRAMVAIKPHRATAHPLIAEGVEREQIVEDADATGELPAAYHGEDTVPIGNSYDTGSLPAQGVPGISPQPPMDDSGVILINFR
jgi:hypothetical protein